ncbi:MAG: hypothetical protein JO255_03565 [Alphaproteobacteria bacterium]|nr:hypothetical protein [Alphaproteobacteria bacterium]
MDAKQAFAAMKSKPVQFWYCAQDEKGKPRFLFHQTQIPQAEIDAVLKTAKNKTVSKGVMKLEKTGELNVITKAAPPSGLARNVQIVARDANAMPKEIKLGTQAILESKALGSQYQDEDKKVGWRAPPLKRPAGMSDNDFAALQKRHAAIRESDLVTTKYFDEAERKDAEVRINSNGVAKTSSGRLDDGKHGFVVDPKTGKTHVFDSQQKDLGGGRKQFYHHSTPLAGGDVAGAGHLKTEDGHITKIDDQSGHYKPDARMTYNVVKELDKEGALERPAPDAADPEAKHNPHREAKVQLLDKKSGLTDEQWQEVKGDEKKIVDQAKLNQLKQPLGEKAYADLMLKKPAELRALMASGKFKSVADLKAHLAEIEFKKLSEEVKADPDKLKAKAKELNVRLKTPEDLDDPRLNQTTANFQIGKAGMLTKKKSQFVQSKGNEDQMRTKDRMLRELKAKQPKQKARDNDPSSKAVKHDAPMPSPYGSVSAEDFNPEDTTNPTPYGSVPTEDFNPEK